MAVSPLNSAAFLIGALASVPAAEIYVTPRLIADQDTIEAGKSFRLGIKLSMKPGWHTYYKFPGDAGMATSIQWTLPKGFHSSSLKWQRPNRFTEAGITTFGYQDETLITTKVTPPADLPVGRRIEFKALVKWLSCKEICIPGKQEVTLTLSVAQPSHSVNSNSAEFATANFDGPISELSTADHSHNSVLDIQFKPDSQSENHLNTATYLFFAWLGGLILNFMPCVLPVVAIKVLGWIEQSRHSSRSVRISNLVYIAGILISFATLAGVVIAAQAAGHKLGWGFQFQYPPFLIFMSAVVLLFALSLFGLFHVGVGGEQTISKLADRNDLVGTFFKGVLATILSTPCTAPFLGTALGFALVQPWWLVLTFFVAIGIGMSTPYLILMINPDWLRHFPKPGIWMEKLKEFMAFVLLATVAWLLSVLSDEIGHDGTFAVIYFLISVSLAGWFTSRFSNLSQSTLRRWSVRLLSLGAIAISAQLLLGGRSDLLAPIDKQIKGTANGESPSSSVATNSLTWQPFTIEFLDQSLHTNKTVFIDFSAQWCLTCKANENLVLNSPTIVSKMKEFKVVTIKADWTAQDPTITRMLAKFKRSGVPLYVVFPAGHADSPIILPEVITVQLVLDKLQQAGPSQ